MNNNRTVLEMDGGGGHYSHYYVSDIANTTTESVRAKSTETTETSGGSSDAATYNFVASKQLDEKERGKIEMFYRSHRTFIYVGQCLANLYLTNTELVDGGRRSRPLRQDWQLTLTGVPLLLLNKGDTKSRDKRQLRICLAQVGTGFPLWADIIDNLSDYRADGTTTTFQTMYLSTDHRKMAGLSFDCRIAAEAFLAQLEAIVSNPLNISLTGPKKRQSLKLFARRRSKSVGRLSETSEVELGQDGITQCSGKRPPRKTDISQPCLFQHITSVNLYNCDPVTLAMVQQQHQLQQKQTARAPTFSSIDSPVYSTPEPMDMLSSSSRSSTSSSCTSHYDRMMSRQSRRLAPPIPLDRATSFHEMSTDGAIDGINVIQRDRVANIRHFVTSSNASNFSY